jgi:hypothetical protein
MRYVLILFLCLSASLSAQVPNTYQATANWQLAGNDIPVRETICATIEAATYGDGAIEASNAIEAAAIACGTGEVVKLGHGRFRTNLPIGINRSDVTIRGSGNRIGNSGTLLEKNNSAFDTEAVIRIGSTEFPNPDESTDVFLSADANPGDTTITVTSATGFAVGQFVKIDADEWTTASYQSASPLKDGTVMQIYGTDRVRYRIRNPPSNNMCTPPTCASLDDYSRQYRVITEMKEVTAVTADGAGGAPDTITFATPIMIAFPTSKGSQVIRYTGTSVHSQRVGVEDLTITGGSAGSLRVTTCAYCWAKNVEIRNFLGPAVDMYDMYRFEFRDGYVHHAYNPVPGGGGYAFSIRDGGGLALIENNIVLNANKMVVGRASGAGSVYAYNYAQDARIYYDTTFMEVGLNASHYPAPHHWLFEGNQAQNYDSDATFGSSIYMTTLRNWLEGERRSFPTNIGRSYRAVGLMEGSAWHAFYGNVLGRPVFVEPESDWIYNDPGDGTASGANQGFDLNHAAIWRLGYSSINAQLADTHVTSTVIRDGNYDYLTDSQQWHNTSAVTMDDSFYLSGKPPFFTSAQTWPWVDPTNGTTYELPAKVRYEALAQYKRHRLRFKGP